MADCDAARVVNARSVFVVGGFGGGGVAAGGGGGDLQRGDEFGLPGVFAEPLDLAGGDIADGADDLEFAGAHFVEDFGAVLVEVVHGLPDVLGDGELCDGGFVGGGVVLAGAVDGGGDVVDEAGDLSVELSAGGCRGDGAALGVTHDDEEGRVEVADAVLDGAGFAVTGDITGDADDEDIADAAVEDAFDGEAGVGAGEDGDEGVLAGGGEVFAAAGLGVGGVGAVGDPAFVAFLKPGEGGVGIGGGVGLGGGFGGGLGSGLGGLGLGLRVVVGGGVVVVGGGGGLCRGLGGGFRGRFGGGFRGGFGGGVGVVGGLSVGVAVVGVLGEGGGCEEAGGGDESGDGEAVHADLQRLTWSRVATSVGEEIGECGRGGEEGVGVGAWRGRRVEGAYGV